MKVDTIIGIDPGKTGGIAIKFRNQYKVHKMPDDLVKIDEMLKVYKDIGTVLVIIEQIRLHITSDIAILLKTDIDTAEKIKLEFGFCKPLSKSFSKKKIKITGEEPLEFSQMLKFY